MITIELNSGSAIFAGKPIKQCRVVISATDSSVVFPFSDPGKPSHIIEQGNAGTSKKRLEVTGKRHLSFTDEEFAMLGSITTSSYYPAVTKTLLVDLVKKGHIIVKQDGETLTVKQILEFSL